MEEKLKSFIAKAKKESRIEDVSYEEISSSKKSSLNKTEEIITVEAEPVRRKGPNSFFWFNRAFSGDNFNW